MESLSPGRLFEDQLVGASSPAYWAFAGVFLLLLLGSLFVYLQSDQRFGGQRLHRRLARRFAALVAVFSGMGLASATFALLAVPFLSKRIWFVAALLGLLGTIVYAGLYFRRRYPAELLAEEDRQRRERYLPRSKTPARKRKAKRR